MAATCQPFQCRVRQGLIVTFYETIIDLKAIKAGVHVRGTLDEYVNSGEQQ